ncbi:MAG: hypothetical protein J4F39_13110 [Candidatus Latescibacteria bacterium]|nr:hypothetical protein [Candidatus Latescibacterota bacterium]
MKSARTFSFLCLAVLLSIGASIHAREKVSLQVTYPDGRTIKYKHKYSFAFKSDRAEVIVPGRTQRGFTSGEIRGEWRSREVIHAGTDGESNAQATRLVATLNKAVNGFFFENKRLTHDQFPYTLEQLDDWEFTWFLSSDGAVQRQTSNNSARDLNRPDVLTDLWQIWTPELKPVLPENPVGPGDTWSGEVNFKTPVMMIDDEAIVELKSTYKVKNIATKKGNKIVTFEEDRKVRFRAPVNIGSLQLVVDGTGEGKGTWVIDATRGIVISHKVRSNLTRPEVRRVDHRKPVDNIRAEIDLSYERKLDKVEKE